MNLKKNYSTQPLTILQMTQQLLWANQLPLHLSDDIHIPTEKVGCLQVTSQLQEFLNNFPPESKEKAFEQIYQILQVLDAYVIDHSQQHQYCMSSDSEYISLITYTTKLEIDLCNFLAIWAVLSILLDSKSNKLQYVKLYSR